MPSVPEIIKKFQQLNMSVTNTPVAVSAGAVAEGTPDTNFDHIVHSPENMAALQAAGIGSEVPPALTDTNTLLMQLLANQRTLQSELQQMGKDIEILKRDRSTSPTGTANPKASGNGPVATDKDDQDEIMAEPAAIHFERHGAQVGPKPEILHCSSNVGVRRHLRLSRTASV